jgi:hypothetical protein
MFKMLKFVKIRTLSHLYLTYESLRAISALEFLENTTLSIWAVFYSKMGKMGVKRWGNFESFPNVKTCQFMGSPK